MQTTSVNTSLPALAEQLQATIAQRRQQGLPLFWPTGACSLCGTVIGYDFEQPQPHRRGGCSCDNHPPQPTSWIEVANYYEQHATAAAQWWAMRPTPEQLQQHATELLNSTSLSSLFWLRGYCSSCRAPFGYRFTQPAVAAPAEAAYVSECSCAHEGSHPASWQQVAASFAAAPDMRWWQFGPEVQALLQQEAKILHMQHRPEVHIERVLIDVAYESPSTTILAVWSSGEYGAGVKVKTFPAAGPAPDLLTLMRDVLQWPAASPAVLQWLERQPKMPAD